MEHWYDKLRAIQSLGSQTERPGSLAGLHEARQRHLGQFFTPDDVAKFMWGLVEGELEKAARHGKVSVIDTSVGSGRLLQHCVPGKHVVGGLDVHAPVIAQVQETFEAAGFECQFEHGGMEQANASGWSVAIINPPFSVRLESPLLEHYPCCSFGKFGPGTSAQSDYYAIAQALDCASAGVALVPRTVAERVWNEPGLVDPNSHCLESRLKARFDLPTDTFREEGAVVEVSVLVFGTARTRDSFRRHEVLTNLVGVEPVKDLYVQLGGRAKIRIAGVEDSGPTITLPVTGDKTVRLGHDGRKIRLKFSCGFTQARVMNAVLNRRIVSTQHHRLPKTYRYAGDGKLDLQVHLLQDDAIASLHGLVELIHEQDAVVIVDRGFWPYVRKLMRRHARAATPMSHAVWQQTTTATRVRAKARKVVIIDKASWLSPVVDVGQELEFGRDGDSFVATVGDRELRLGFEELNASFAEIDGMAGSGWAQVHEGMQRADRQTAMWWKRRLDASGIGEWLTWEFQREDLIELLMSPRGAVCAWNMGLGKTRLAVALVLLSGVHRSLVTTEAYLVPEFVEKLRELPIPDSEWKVIEGPDDLVDLRRINLISNERLRMTLPGQKRVTYAHRLRRRVGMAISDEGEFLANPMSAQSRALWRVSAQRRFVLSGTPIGSYPRDVLCTLCYAAGDATAAQPWGYYGPYLERVLVKSCQFASRGIDRFIESFVTLEWVTNEWAESMREGAKREVPKIGNLREYRAMLAPHIKRRVIGEPEVERYVKIPKPDYLVHEIEWDDDHLAHYVRVADEFAQWMGRGESNKKNLMVVLLRFGAVIRALNMPQEPAKHVHSVYTGVTSKQRFVAERVEELAGAGEKIICYTHSPQSAELLARMLRDGPGIDPVVLHGGITAARRHKLLNQRFKQGSAEVLMATVGVTQAGLNVPQATRVLFYDRDWTSKVEQQSLARALRPETDHPVTAEFFHICGSADEYQAQMVAFKQDCFNAGLDWATPEMEGVDFLHLDTIMSRFIADLAERRGLKGHELREQLKLVA